MERSPSAQKRTRGREQKPLGLVDDPIVGHMIDVIDPTDRVEKLDIFEFRLGLDLNMEVVGALRADGLDDSIFGHLHESRIDFVTMASFRLNEDNCPNWDFHGISSSPAIAGFLGPIFLTDKSEICFCCSRAGFCLESPQKGGQAEPTRRHYIL